MRSQGRNFFLDDCKGQAVDIYEGWVVVRVGKYWYRARIAPGFVSLVDYTTPNAHTAVIKLDDFRSLQPGQSITGHPFTNTPFVMLSTQEDGISEYDLATIRYGRVGTIGRKPNALVDGFGEEASIARGVFGDASADLPAGA